MHLARRRLVLLPTKTEITFSAPVGVGTVTIAGGRPVLPPQGVTTGDYNVFPLKSPSIFDNDDRTLWEPDATFSIVDGSVVDLGGTFTIYDGGGLLYQRGSTIGTAQFTYIVYYDSLGSTVSSTVFINVQ